MGQYTPSEERVALADSLFDHFADEEVDERVALSSELLFTFHRNTDGTVYAIETWTDHFISLVDENKFGFYRSQDNYSKITSVNAYTGKKQSNRKKLSPECISNFSESIFDSDLEVCSYQHEINQKGEEAKIKSVKRYNDLKYLTSVDLHEDYPMLQRKVIFRVPKWLEVAFHELNTEGIEILREEVKVGVNTDFVFTVSGIPGYGSLYRAPGTSHYAPLLVPVFKSYVNGAGEKTPMFETIDHQYSWYKGLVDEVSNSENVFKDQVELLIKDKTTDEEKVSAIFYWVQDNIRYIAFERGIMGFRPEPAHKVYAKRFGDCKGMANLTKAMLKIAGYDARLCWVGTNILSEKYDYSFPSLANDNHMICMVELNGTPYFLDATEEFVALGDCAARIQGRKTMVENGDGFSLFTIPVDNPKANAKRLHTRLSIHNEKLKGSAAYTYTGEEKRILLQTYAAIRKQNRELAVEAFLSDEDKNVTILNNSNTDFGERSGDLKFKYDFEIENRVMNHGNKVYVNIAIDREYERFDLKEDRLVGYDMSHARVVEATTEVVIPEGYKVSSVPEGATFKNDLFQVDLKYEEAENKVTFSRYIELTDRIITTDQIAEWNKAIAQLNRVYGEYIVLEKL